MKLFSVEKKAEITKMCLIVGSRSGFMMFHVNFSLRLAFETKTDLRWLMKFMACLKPHNEIIIVL